ncbi:FAD-binding oxidoreductase [Halomonas desiderata]|uniref:FAD-binding oxidoreductase n=1 Tax=Billgrantia desiderata TaxID=52021 RepID=A0ABS9B335_9GAMM|nr:FAD-binding oxidoreductase [Halomonas desiderata]MCE8041895.1 FAD-binding oxidoreductase [Halomonas desiderata]MCE8046470.1 FAD-binding oxidoreductase [Halomonas desiderata]NIC35802.1 FAD-binding oxidoreductase [Halomonas desiderata]SEF52723.1 gamma-glutamylputrescine oxidase [Halomonas desiderata]
MSSSANAEHVASYYAATANPSPERPALEGDIECEVCVVGAGFTGISSALHLAEQGHDVVVLEAARVGFGASGRNGGQIVNSYSRDMDVIEAKYGTETARALGDMAFEGNRIIRERIRQYAIACDLKNGNLFAACNRKQLEGLREHKALWERFGNHELELLEGEAYKREIGSERYTGALVDHSGGHLHPLNLVLGQAAAFESLGGVIHERTPVSGVRHGETVTLTTPRGSVRARRVVMAGNAYLQGVLPELESKSMPCGTQIVTTEPLPQALRRELIPNDMAVEDCNYLLDYYRFTADGRLLYGGGVNYGGQDPADIAAVIRPKMLKTFPQLAEVRIDFAWSGNFLMTLNRLPQFGRLNDNVYYAQGYSGHGVTCSHLAGRLIAEVMRGESARFDAFAGLPHLPFPGGRLLRVPLSALGAWYYATRDRLGW